MKRSTHLHQFNKYGFFIIACIFCLGCDKEAQYEKFLTNAVKEKNEGNHKKALSLVNKAIKINSDKPLPYLLRGQINALLKSDSSAILDLNMAINLDTTLIAAYFYKGISFSNLDQFDSSISNFDKAIALKMKNEIIIDMINTDHIPMEKQTDVPYVQIKFYRGISLLLSQKWNDSKEAFLYTLAKKYEIPWSEYYLGITYIQMGQTSIGCTYLIKAKSDGLENVDELISEYCKE